MNSRPGSFRVYALPSRKWDWCLCVSRSAAFYGHAVGCPCPSLLCGWIWYLRGRGAGGADWSLVQCWMVFLQLLICLLPGHFSPVFQQPQNGLMLLITQLILICYVFSCAPAWIVFSRAVVFGALWAFPRLCLSFRLTDSLILLQCFSRTCILPSFIPAPCAFAVFSGCHWTAAICSAVWWQSPSPWGFSNASVGWFPLTRWAHYCSLLLCPWRTWEAELSLHSLQSPCQLALK